MLDLMCSYFTEQNVPLLPQVCYNYNIIRNKKNSENIRKIRDRSIFLESVRLQEKRRFYEKGTGNGIV